MTDGTRNFHHTGLVSWFGNNDGRRCTLFGQDLFWIRIVDESGAYRSREWAQLKPGIEGIYPNSTVIRGIETMEEMYRIDVRAEEKRIQLPYTDLADIRVDVLERAEYRDGALTPVWETWTEVGELAGDSETRREFVADRCGGTLFFPKYMRSTRLTEQEEIEIRVRYTFCRGAAGNVQVGTVDRLSRTVGFVNTSFNPIATSGGTDREKVLQAVDRNAKILRHRYRCVSVRDYEDMAREAVGNISRIRCFSGFDENRKRQPGAVTLVVLPEDYEEETVSFESMKERIFAYLSAHMDENIIRAGKFHIVKPRMIKIDVRVCLSLTEEREIFAARRRILDRLDRFLDPVDGNFYGEGWEIGVFPDKNQILYAVKGVEGIRSVRQLTLRKYQKDRAGEPEFRDDGNYLSYLLPESGQHEIIIDL